MRTVYAGVFLISCLMGYFIFDAGSRPAVIPQLSSLSITIKPQYALDDVFTSALQSVRGIRNDLGNPIHGAIINHHLIVPQFIADTLQYAKAQDIDRILLLAPNHFSAGRGYFITTDESFMTPFGIVQTDQTAVRELVATSGVVQDAEPFQGEHGIYNILPFLHEQFADIPVVPIIMRDGTPIAQVDQLREQLKPFLTPHTLVIASLDFAHNQTNAGAQALDRMSIAQLSSIDPQRISPNPTGTIQVDSPMTLRLFLGIMKDQRARVFTLTHHSNSALETGRLEALDVTSHITGLFSSFPVVVH